MGIEERDLRLQGSQRYVSSELTHFVGRGLPEEPAQYRLLIKILAEGWLTHPPHDPTGSSRIIINGERPVCSNEMYNPDMVCFCDIPVEDLSIHMAKYSRFGLSFSKTFLVKKGANPVFYVARSSQLPEFRTEQRHEAFVRLITEAKSQGRSIDDAALDAMQVKTTRAVWFDQLGLVVHREWHRSIKESIDARKDDLDQLAEENMNRAFDIGMLNELLSFIKCFDPSEVDDPENFYMEREWRVLGNLQFTQDDIERIVLPREYRGGLRRDLAHYSGQVSFVN